MTLGGCSKSQDAEVSAVVLEAASSSGAAPFTHSVATNTGASERADQASATSTTVSGEEAGLYGGSLAVSVCDREALSNFLEANPAQDRAFSSIAESDDVRSYVDSLSPVVLTRDTRVTNHGFENNEATSYQAVLQAGTAVLIDDRGVPRVRCASGNPLAQANETTADYTGSRWNNFSEDRVVTVDPAPEPMSSAELTSLDGSGSATTIVIGEPAPVEVVTPDTALSPGGGTPAGPGAETPPASSAPIPEPGGTGGGGVTGGGEVPGPNGGMEHSIEPVEPTTAETVPGVTAPETVPPPTE